MPVYRKKTTKDNKRKKVVKGKSVTGGSKFKSVTNKKTGTTTTKTKTKKGNYRLSAEAGPVTKATKRKTVQTKVSAKGLMPMLRQIAPDSPTAKAAMKALKLPVKAKKAKRVKK